MQPLEILLVGGRIDALRERRRRRGRQNTLGVAEMRGERAGDRARDLVLHLEDVDELAVEALGPHLKAVLRVHELRGDADAVPGLAHAAFDDRRDAELLSEAA